jgi:Transposase IS4
MQLLQASPQLRRSWSQQGMGTVLRNTTYCPDDRALRRHIHSIPLHYVQHPIHYFELFWGPEVWNILVENTNTYAQYKEAQHKEDGRQKSRWWKAITLYEMRIFTALLIYIGIVGTSNIASYYDKSRDTIHKPIESIAYFQFQQIKLFFMYHLPLAEVT